MRHCLVMVSRLVIRTPSHTSSSWPWRGEPHPEPLRKHAPEPARELQTCRHSDHPQRSGQAEQQGLAPVSPLEEPFAEARQAVHADSSVGNTAQDCVSRRRSLSEEPKPSENVPPPFRGNRYYHQPRQCGHSTQSKERPKHFSPSEDVRECRI